MIPGRDISDHLMLGNPKMKRTSVTEFINQFQQTKSKPNDTMGSIYPNPEYRACYISFNNTTAFLKLIKTDLKEIKTV